jgi:V8-like Glu-specific endopeptidase
MNVAQTGQDNFLRLTSDVCPVVLVDVKHGRALAHCGTGFVLPGKLFITCWHCVADEPENGCAYAAAISRGPGKGFDVAYLKNLERDGNGTDLAIANIDRESSLGLRLSSEEQGQVFRDVIAWGYPLPGKDVKTGEIKVNGRGIKGYIMRAMWYDHPMFGRTDSYELDMPTPEGLSGSPVLLADSNDIIGVVYGENDVRTIEQYGRIDPKTGEAVPEINRVVSFGLAHHINALRAVEGMATGGEPLETVLAG